MMRSRFKDKPSAAWLAVVNAIRKLEASEGGGGRAYAEATHARSREQWAETRGLRESRGHACVQRVIGSRCTLGQYAPAQERPCQPPGTDHPSLWLRDGRPAVYVSQPYGLGGEELTQMVAFAGANRLHVNLDTWPAWHFPTAVLMVEWWADWAWRDYAGYSHRL